MENKKTKVKKKSKVETNISYPYNPNKDNDFHLVPVPDSNGKIFISEDKGIVFSLEKDWRDGTLFLRQHNKGQYVYKSR